MQRKGIFSAGMKVLERSEFNLNGKMGVHHSSNDKAWQKIADKRGLNWKEWQEGKYVTLKDKELSAFQKRVAQGHDKSLSMGSGDVPLELGDVGFKTFSPQAEKIPLKGFNTFDPNKVYDHEGDMQDAASADKSTHHHIKMHCQGCGVNQTCRCSAAKVQVQVKKCHNCDDSVLKKRRAASTAAILRGLPTSPAPEGAMLNVFSLESREERQALRLARRKKKKEPVMMTESAIDTNSQNGMIDINLNGSLIDANRSTVSPVPSLDIQISLPAATETRSSTPNSIAIELGHRKKRELVKFTEGTATLRERAILHSLGTRVQAARREGWNRQQIYTEIGRVYNNNDVLTPEEEAMIKALVDQGDIQASQDSLYCPACGCICDCDKDGNCECCGNQRGGAVNVFTGNAFGLSNSENQTMSTVLEVPIELGATTGKLDKVIAVDLDGTLVKKQEPFNPLGFGDPIPERWDEVRGALSVGQPVVIFTARVADDPTGEIKAAIEDLCMEELGQVLPVTNEKTPNMIRFIDDRAEAVVPDGTDMPILTASLDIPLELGDTPGHQFHGNQWTGGGGGAQGGAAPAVGPHPAFARFKQPMRKLLRWCGKEGMDLKQAKAAIQRAGLKMPPDPTIRAELPIGGRGQTRGGRAAEMPNLTDEQKAVLRGRIGPTDPGVPARQQKAAAEFQQQQAAKPAKAPKVAPAAAPAAPAALTYTDHKDRAERADAAERAVRDRIVAGELGNGVYKDRAQACLAAEKIHKEAGEAARAAGDPMAAEQHFLRADAHAAKAQKYNDKLPAGDKIDQNHPLVRAAIKAVDDGRRPVAPVTPSPPISVSPDALKRESELSSTPAKNIGEVPGGGGIGGRMGGDHVSQIFMVTTADGKKHVFKPVNGERGFFGVSDEPKGTDARREVAAYEMAKVVGMTDLVPVTVMRDQPKIKTANGDHEVSGPGSAQDFCPDCRKGGQSSNRWDGKEDAERCAAFDYVMGIADRHAGNWLIDHNGLDTGRIHLIDHGWSLPDKPGVSIDSRGFFGYARSEHTPISENTRKAWSGKWDLIANGLQKAGIGPKAIARCKTRYNNLLAAKNYRDLSYDA